MTSQTEKAARFIGLHRPGSPLLLPNPWDQGSARLLASLGFQALATTSSGFAATLGRSDGSVSRDEALAHAAAIVAATDLPVSADLENCFADDPAGVAQTVALAAETGLAGCSVEDFTGDDDAPIYDIGLAAERVAAAVAAAHAGPARLVLTARAENYLYGRADLADTITRLQAYQAAGADVLYAPGLTSLSDIRQLVTAVDRPVNVLAMPGTPPVSELAGAGVSRVSVGGALAFAALGALVDAATELRDEGTYGYLEGTAAGRRALKGVVLARLRYRCRADAAVAPPVPGRRPCSTSGSSGVRWRWSAWTRTTEGSRSDVGDLLLRQGRQHRDRAQEGLPVGGREPRQEPVLIGLDGGLRLGADLAAGCGDRQQSDAAVGGVRLAGDEAGPLKLVQGGDDPGLVRSDRQRQRRLGARGAAVERIEHDVAPHRNPVPGQHRQLGRHERPRQWVQHRGQVPAGAALIRHAKNIPVDRS